MIRLAFYKHFSEARHLLDKLFPGPSPSEVSEAGHLFNVGHPLDLVSHFSFQPFISTKVLRTVQSTDPKS